MGLNTLSLDEYAEKVASISNRKTCLTVRNKITISAIRIYSIPKCLKKHKKEDPSEFILKNLQKVFIGGGDGNRAPLLDTAKGASTCCQRQDLHLFQFEKVYLEKKGTSRKLVVGWKLPKQMIVERHLVAFIEELKKNRKVSHRYFVTWLLQGKKEGESDQEQIELLQRQKGARNYSSNTKSLFQ